jgi:uncharacterized membrane protein YgcG
MKKFYKIIHKHSRKSLFQVSAYMLFAALIFVGLKTLKSSNIAFASTLLNVTVLNVNPTQAILTYTAPDTNACSVEVSESSGYTPLVHDVDPSLFAGSNLDSRSSGTGTANVSRVFVVGKRAAEKATDNKFYSRALQTHKLQYYRITCGSAINTGSFTTANIPIGNNYPELLPADPLNPGAYAYPTISTSDRTQQIIDPQTGLLIEPLTVSTDGFDPSHTNFTAAGFMNHCSNQLVSDSLGDQGYHCLIGSALFWINAITGESRPLTSIGIPNNPAESLEGGPCYWGFVLDFSKPGTVYCSVDDGGLVAPAPAHRLIVQIDYLGSNVAGNGTSVLQECNGSNQPCLQYTLITPPSNDLYSKIQAFDTHFNDFTPHTGCYISTIQNNNLILYCQKSGQDTIAWLAVFNLNTNSIIAAIPTWEVAPLRWGVLHSVAYNGDVNWLGFVQNTTERYPGTSFSSKLTQSLSTTLTTCPVNSFGATGANCSDINVDGQPCASSPENSDEITNPVKCVDSQRPYYLQDAQPGDYAHFGVRYGTNSETVRIIAMNGNTWTIQRNITDTDWILTPRTQPIGTLLTMIGSSGQISGSSWYWDYINDPRGVNSGNATIIRDTNFNGNHTVYRPNLSVEGNRVRFGAIPDFINATPVTVLEDGPFAGLVQDMFNGIPWTVDEHPSEPFYNQWYLDANPWQGGHWPTTSGQSLGGTLYKFTSNAYGGNGTQTNLHPDLVPTLATSGHYILQDVSGPNSVITTGSSDNYKYCIAKNAGECFSGSNIGDVYVNAPDVTTAYCVDAGRSGQNGWLSQDICIGDNGTRVNTIIQQGIAVPDTVGVTGRVLSRGFIKYRRQEEFSNVHALPNGNWFMFQVPPSADYGGESGQLFIAKIPPFPSADSVDRTNFLPISVTVPRPTVAGAVSSGVLFGYAENGSVTDFHCTSRQESCFATNKISNQYSYLSDAPTPVSCLLGCTITVPAVPGRVVYLRSQYLNVRGNVVEQNNIQVAIAEPPYTVSPVVSSDITPPVISSISVGSLNTSSVTLTWLTNESSDTQVEYGLTTDYGQSTTLDSSLTTTHTVNVGSLLTHTMYHYRVKSRDADGNLGTSSDGTFTTASSVSSGGGGGYSGGGGGGGNTGTVSVEPSPDTGVNINTPTTVKVPSSLAQLPATPGPVISHPLRVGVTTYISEIKNLQRYLIQKGYLASGLDTGFFGNLTRTALQRFQCKTILVCSGNEVSTGYGVAGPKTRAAILQNK